MLLFPSMIFIVLFRFELFFSVSFSCFQTWSIVLENGSLYALVLREWINNIIYLSMHEWTIFTIDLVVWLFMDALISIITVKSVISIMTVKSVISIMTVKSDVVILIGIYLVLDNLKIYTSEKSRFKRML